MAYDNLEEVFNGLLFWSSETGEPHMSYDHVVAYYNDLYNAFNSIDNLVYHSPVRYATHRKYGAYAYQYRRNRRTSWYGIYDRYECDCFLNRILSNYRTIGNATFK